MAFQTGSQVRPELGRADVSGFARAGESIGAALAGIGKSVGEGFAKYRENKEVTAASLAALEAISVSRPDAYAELRNSDKKIGNILRSIEDGNYKRNDLQSAIGALQTSIAAKDARQASELRDLQLRSAQSEQQQQIIDRDAANMALAASREAGTGDINTQDAVSAYISQGGRDPNFFNMIESMQPETAGLSEAEQEIQRVMKANPGISFTDAVNIKEGVVKIISNPVTGDSFLVNLATGEEKPLQSSSVITAATSSTLAPSSDADPSSINLYKIAESTTGIIPAIKAAAQRVTGQIGIDVADPELLENIQTFQTAQSDIRRSMRTAPKFLASEMALLDKELNISPGPFKDSATLLAQIRSVNKSVRNRLKAIAKSINDPNLPADERAAGLRLQNDLTNFLRILGVPQGEESAEGMPPSPDANTTGFKIVEE
tara:strand:- start:1240 stop:2535 length:1296 start_codon:yes stop_codon:yes gene_type:complete